MATQISPIGGQLPMPALPSSGAVGGAAAPAQSPAPQATPRADNVEAALAHVNQHLQQAQAQVRLQVDPGSGRTVYQVVQEGSGRVLLQMPSAEVLNMSRRLRQQGVQTGSGALVDKQG